ncbi:polyprenyl synthetase family protein [Xanthobacter sediminis]|uniref:polyprenyl synthetase family protein n=1 Tax=Xanthobacter sediminis TaxID=3119926 RepID=UPI003726E6C3
MTHKAGLGADGARSRAGEEGAPARDEPAGQETFPSQETLPGQEEPTARDAPRPPLQDLSYLRAVVDRRLGLLVPPPAIHPAALHAAMRHILLAPGKRLRPLLAMAAALQLDASEHAVLDFGCALEMIHAASLIMDDLPCMDDAATRRARPATHVQFGEDVALLAAIGLLSRAFGVAADAPGVNAEARLAAVSTLSLAVGSLGLSGGQLDDLRPASGRPVTVTEDVNRRKTGVLFSAAAEIAGRVAGADEARRADLAAFAAHVGRAYQILDDILDGTASGAALGKDVGKDAGRATVVAALGAPAARTLLAEHLASAAAASRRIGPNDHGHEPLRLFLAAAFGELAPAGA